MPRRQLNLAVLVVLRWRVSSTSGFLAGLAATSPILSRPHTTPIYPTTTTVGDPLTPPREQALCLPTWWVRVNWLGWWAAGRLAMQWAMQRMGGWVGGKEGAGLVGMGGANRCQVDVVQTKRPTLLLAPNPQGGWGGWVGNSPDLTCLNCCRVTGGAAVARWQQRPMPQIDVCCQ